MDNSTGLVSCLCVTHKKPDLLARAVACFLSQSYPSKQLVIVYENIDHATELYVDELKHTPGIKLVKADSKIKKKTLGELRNIAVASADGEYVCQWDDDDWYHPDRLLYQLNALLDSGKPASILSQWLIFNEVDKKIYCSHRRLWEGSIFCKKDIFQLRSYAAVSIGEDTDVINFLHERGYLTEMSAPYLYVYIYHSKNTWSFEHFKEIFDHSTVMPGSVACIMQEILIGRGVPGNNLDYLMKSTSNFTAMQ